MTHEYYEWLAGEIPDDAPEPLRPADRTPHYLHVYNGDGVYLDSDVYYGMSEKGVAMRALVARCGVRYVTAQSTRAATLIVRGKQWDVTECEFIGSNGDRRAYVGLSGRNASDIEHPPHLTVVGGRVSSY